MERQELHCHACNHYVQFDMDLTLNGNHILYCPNCGHEHCRVVKNGVITDDRWDSRNPNTHWASNVVFSTTSTWTSYQGAISTNGASTATTSNGYNPTIRAFVYGSWMNSVSTS